MPVDGTPPRGSSASSRPVSVPNWDLLIVLEGLLVPYFKPLESAPDRILTLKVVLLLASASLKHVRNLQALSMNEPCMEFSPGLEKMFL